MTDRELMQMAQNTDRELWREREDDFYADSIHVTKDGRIGMNVGGTVFVMTIKAWHDAAALRDRLAQPEPEPVAWGNKKGEFKVHQEADENFKSTALPFYTTPSKREWVGLTNEEIEEAIKSCNTIDTYKYFRAIEAKLKEKNT